MKTNILRIILLLLLLGTFYIIFGFSSQDGEESGSISRNITETIASKISQIRELENGKREEVLYRMEKVIRKIAHFSIYTIVGILLMLLISTYNLKEKYRVNISLIIGILYASSDELHQKFIAGRSAKITDVMIDTLGVMVGITLIMIVKQVIQTIKKRENDKNLQKNMKTA